MFEPIRVLRWLYIGRLSLAFSVFLAALFAWQDAESHSTMVASLAMVIALGFTAASSWFGALRGPSSERPVGRGFYTAQAVFDVVLVTAVVHVTGGAQSQFAALYILVTAAASLLLPAVSALLIAAFGIALYAGDVLLSQHGTADISVLLQIGVFAAVALGVTYLAARLQEAGGAREELEARLVLAKLQAEDILHNIRSGIITVDSSGSLIFANPSAGALLGFDSTTARGRTVQELISIPAPALAAALERAVHQRERVTRGEASITLHGRAVSIGFTTTTMVAAGAPDQLSATVIFQDISDNKRLEELRMRTERLEAVAELSASLAHEIKNPLASIRSAVEQLALSAGAGEDERTLGRLIVRESDRLSRLLSEFLDFARVRVTRGSLVDIAGIARAAASLAAGFPEAEKEVALECEIPEEPVLIEGDEDLLHRAVFNLVLNAIQASPQGGKVRVELSEMTGEQLPRGVLFPDNAIALHVLDEGPGIPADLRDRVFDPFFTTKAGGTGLGLPIVHRAVDAHRGVVLVDSSSRGTRFSVLLPRSRFAEAEAA
ncbi:MAG TPA: ATP-binding protein [Gemmatimonadaceae bacterium]|jgi:two-component system sensor histidine kinase PilS (NtrC family)|nr:ATP-binding protein [Gemmatimonadaceae bacterium]